MTTGHNSSTLKRIHFETDFDLEPSFGTHVVEVNGKFTISSPTEASHAEILAAHLANFLPTNQFGFINKIVYYLIGSLDGRLSGLTFPLHPDQDQAIRQLVYQFYLVEHRKETFWKAYDQVHDAEKAFLETCKNLRSAGGPFFKENPIPLHDEEFVPPPNANTHTNGCSSDSV